MPDLFYFNRHFHSMQAGIPVGTFLQKMETIFVKLFSCEIKSREGERIWSYGRPF